jgi:NADH-quinone oxidoreductase subunit N
MIALAAIDTPTVQWSLISPELVLFGGACFLLLTGALMRPGARARYFSATVALLALSGAALASLLLWNDGGIGMSGQLIVDDYGTLVRLIVMAAGICAVALTWGTHRLDTRTGELHALILTAAAGLSLLAVSNGFVTLFVALELFSLSLYILCALDVRDAASLESGLKYLIVGSVGSSFLLFGSALVYGGTGSLQFDEIARGMTERSDEALILFGIGMIVAGLAFKASAAPFHMWTPDVYEGAPTGVTAFMAVATKAVALAVLLRVVSTAFDPASDVWEGAIAAIAIASMIIGNVAALVQQNAKRMLAYSSIGHAGYLLIPIVSHTEAATRALLFYLVVYAAMTIGAFAVIAVREREVGGPVGLAELAGMGYSRPFLGAAFSLFLLSLASFPPTGGFLAKFTIFQAAIDAGDTYLVVVGVIGTVISLGYYLRFGLAVWSRPEGTQPGRVRVPGTAMAAATTLVAAAVVVWLGIAPDTVLDWAQEAARTLAPGSGA